MFPTSQSGDIKELFVKQSWFTLTFNSIHPDMRSCFVIAPAHHLDAPSWCIFLNMVLIWFPVCIRRDHHHGPAGPWTEVRVHPDSQSRGWRGGPSAKDWHRYGNNFVAIIHLTLQLSEKNNKVTILLGIIIICHIRCLSWLVLWRFGSKQNHNGLLYKWAHKQVVCHWLYFSLSLSHFD